MENEFLTFNFPFSVLHFKLDLCAVEKPSFFFSYWVAV